MTNLYREKNFQQTINEPVEYLGVALHGGEEIKIRLLPGEVDSGIVFRRVDLPGSPEVKSVTGQVVSTKRCTSIGANNESVVHTVEHIMAACWAMKVDNLVIEIDGPETPVGDGSSYPFIELLQKAGKNTQKVKRRIWTVENPVWVRRGKMYMTVLPYDGFKVSYTLDYDHPVIGTQFFEFDSQTDSFIDEIARARTFGFEKEVEALHKRGLALGGSLENAVLIGEKETVNSLRFPNEFVRHKVLDVIGDMALNGFIKGHIITVRSGHSLHVELAREICKKLKEQESELDDRDT
jgi:UDP-3-O-[3-hydroxymyristoyl] N-acetylglucosamine deacetylase